MTEKDVRMIKQIMSLTPARQTEMWEAVFCHVSHGGLTEEQKTGLNVSLVDLLQKQTADQRPKF